MRKKQKKIPVKPASLEKPAQLSDRYSYLLLSAILFLALILRITALLDLSNSLYFDFLLWDERVYHTWAAKIANGTYQSSSVYEMAPFPAYLMAFIYKIFSPDILYIRILNIFFGVLTCYLVYLIGKEMANRKIGLFACLVACLYKPFIFYSIVPLKTSLSVFLFALIIYLFVAILNKNSMVKVLLLGIAIGLANNVRPNCAVLIPVIPLLIIWSMYKGRYSLKVLTATLILYIAGLSIAMSPFMIRNYLVAGESAPTASQSGFNLYIANNLQYAYPLPFASTSPFEQGIHFTIEASRRVGKKLSPREASSYWTNEVIKTAIEKPGAFLWKICRKTIFLFQKYQLTDQYNISFVSDFVTFFKVPFLGFSFIIPFGMTGMVVSILVYRRFLALSTIFFFYALTLIIFFTLTRYRLPLLTILIPFSVIGLNNLLSYVKKKQIRKIAFYAAIVVTFIVIGFLPARRTDDMTAYYNTHAIVLNSKGIEGQAIRYWETSSQMNGRYSPFANLSLAGKYYAKGNIQKALHYLDKISDGSFAAAAKYEMIGDMMMRQRKTEKAITAYEKSLEINSGQRKTRAKLVKIYWNIDKQKAWEEYDKLEYISSFYDIL
ncbi:MAG: tetratricopeptide repeat protein [Desulfobacterales bacterium]|nr:tetratricopeptide repeat protein [Desulfobacterales bacterium]